MKNRFTTFAVAILMGALLVLSLWPAYQSPGPPEDEGIALVYPEVFSKGRLPYRDFETIYGPGNLLVLSASYQIFGTNIFVERTVGLVYRVIILLAIFAIAQRWSILVAVGCGWLGAVLLGGTDLFANSWLAATALALIAFWLAAESRSLGRSVAAGLFMTGALLCRCDLLPALAIGALPLSLGMSPRGRMGFIAGALIGALPLVWFAIEVTPGQLLNSLFLFPVLHLSSAAYLPISSAPLQLRFIFYLQIFCSIVNLTAGIMVWRSDNRQLGQLLLGLALFGGACVYYALSRFDGGHVVNAALVAISFVPVAIFALLRLKLTNVLVAAGTAVVLPVVALHLLVPIYARYLYRGLQVEFGVSPQRVANLGEPWEPDDRGVFVRERDRSFPLRNSAIAEATQQVLDALQAGSAAGQSWIVGPADLRRTVGANTFLYHLMPQLKPATYYLEMNPGSTNAPGSRLAADIASADWLVLDRSWDSINEPNESSRFGSDIPNQVVRSDFDLKGEFGPYILLRNRKLRNLMEISPDQ